MTTSISLGRQILIIQRLIKVNITSEMKTTEVTPKIVELVLLRCPENPDEIGGCICSNRCDIAPSGFVVL